MISRSRNTRSFELHVLIVSMPVAQPCPLGCLTLLPHRRSRRQWTLGHCHFRKSPPDASPPGSCYSHLASKCSLVSQKHFEIDLEPLWWQR